MRKGFFASVAALAAGAGVALGQGVPGGPGGGPPGYGYPAWGGAGPAGGGDPGGFLPGPGGPGGYPAGPGGYPAGPGGYPPGPAGYPAGPVGPGGPMGPGDVPPAADAPLYGPVPGPGCDHPKYPGSEPKYGMQVGQVHKAAGGPDRWYVDLEDMAWAVRTMPIGYPLVTLGSATSAGIVGQPGTRVLFGNQNVDYNQPFEVFRLTLGVWDNPREYGLELSGFVTEHRSELAYFAIPQQSGYVLARPVINALTGQGTSLLVAFPGEFGGSVNVAARFHMDGAEANVMRSLIYCDRIKLNVFAGVRYADLEESLRVSSFSNMPTPDNPDNPTLIAITDEFATRNQFFGGQLGFQSEWRRGRYFMDVTGKVAAGNMNERLNVSGETIQSAGPTTTTTVGGLLALAGNIGKTSKNEFAYLPEATVKLGYQWTQRISTYVGYNGLYMSRVLRPGDQIDPFVNPVLLPISNQFGGTFGPVRPQTILNHSDFWAQGVTLGMSIRY